MVDVLDTVDEGKAVGVCALHEEGAVEMKNGVEWEGDGVMVVVGVMEGVPVDEKEMG